MATVGINLKCNDWKNIRDFWTLQAALEEKDDASEEEDVSSEEEEDYSKEEVLKVQNFGGTVIVVILVPGQYKVPSYLVGFAQHYY